MSEIKEHMPEIKELNEQSLPETCLVFKHSTACSISANAAEEVKQLNTTLPVYWINVIEQRPISNWIESTYEIRHESPQMIYLKDGSPVQSWSHREVTRANVESAL